MNNFAVQNIKQQSIVIKNANVGINSGNSKLIIINKK